jgi:hypothetical protein
MLQAGRRHRASNYDSSVTSSMGYPIHMNHRYSKPITVIVVASIATLVYSLTLMTTISGCTHEYCADVGEFQIALPLWGTVHYTGYPLYMLLGSPFVSILRAIGVPPAAGASIYSLVWGVLAVIGIVIWVNRWGANSWLAGGIGLVFATLAPIWIHATIAEVYSLSLAISVALLIVSFELRDTWSDKLGWLLALLGGIGVGHHRLLALLLLPIGLYLLPAALRSKSVLRWGLIAGLCFIAGFLPYLDIPVRIWLGSTWNYDQANTWPGFLRIFYGTEVARLQKPDFSINALTGAAQSITQVLITELTIPGMLLIGITTVRGIWIPRSRWMTACLVGIGSAYIFFTLIFRNAVLIQATLMTTLLAACMLIASGLSTAKDRWKTVTGVVCVGWSVWLVLTNWQNVNALTKAQNSVDYIATIEGTDAPQGAIVMAPWGGSYFALAYAQRIEGRLSNWQIVDHRADFKKTGIPAPIFTHANSLFVFGLDWWAERLGTPLRVSSAGPNMVLLSAQPLSARSAKPQIIGDNIGLDHWDVRAIAPGKLNVVLYWTAVNHPTTNYSTFVHLSDQETITKPEDILAQSDFSAPVYGRYPTMGWIPNEIVREDHMLSFSPERTPTTIIFGMYRQDPDGTFQRLGQIHLRKQDGNWQPVMP